MSINNPNFDKIEGNPVCLPVPWLKPEESEEQLQAWKDGMTGFPWIDALQKQVRASVWKHIVRYILIIEKNGCRCNERDLGGTTTVSSSVRHPSLIPSHLRTAIQDTLKIEQKYTTVPRAQERMGKRANE